MLLGSSRTTTTALDGDRIAKVKRNLECNHRCASFRSQTVVAAGVLASVVCKCCPLRSCHPFVVARRPIYARLRPIPVLLFSFALCRLVIALLCPLVSFSSFLSFSARQLSLVVCLSSEHRSYVVSHVQSRTDGIQMYLLHSNSDDPVTTSGLR